MNERAGGLTQSHPEQVARGVHVEHDDRHTRLAAQGERGHVHHAQVFADDLAAVDPGILPGRLVALRVGGKDAVDARAFEQHVGVDLQGAQGGRRVGREVRVAGARREDDDLAVGQAPDGSALWVGANQAGKVYRLDPATLEVEAIVPKPFGADELAAAAAKIRNAL